MDLHVRLKSCFYAVSRPYAVSGEALKCCHVEVWIILGVSLQVLAMRRQFPVISTGYAAPEDKADHFCHVWAVRRLVLLYWWWAR